jgi:hypothetical protein
MPAINYVWDLNKALEHGPYAWPGGYPCYFICADGAPLSFDAVKENAGLVRDAVITKDITSGWQVAAFEINWENTDLTCAHTNVRIPSAYGHDDEAEQGE